MNKNSNFNNPNPFEENATMATTTTSSLQESLHATTVSIPYSGVGSRVSTPDSYYSIAMQGSQPTRANSFLGEEHAQYVAQRLRFQNDVNSYQTVGETSFSGASAVVEERSFVTQLREHFHLFLDSNSEFSEAQEAALNHRSLNLFNLHRAFNQIFLDIQEFRRTHANVSVTQFNEQITRELYTTIPGPAIINDPVVLGQVYDTIVRDIDNFAGSHSYMQENFGPITNLILLMIRFVFANSHFASIRHTLTTVLLDGRSDLFERRFITSSLGVIGHDYLHIFELLQGSSPPWLFQTGMVGIVLVRFLSVSHRLHPYFEGLVSQMSLRISLLPVTAIQDFPPLPNAPDSAASLGGRRPFLQRLGGAIWYLIVRGGTYVGGYLSDAIRNRIIMHPFQAAALTLFTGLTGGLMLPRMGMDLSTFVEIARASSELMSSFARSAPPLPTIEMNYVFDSLALYRNPDLNFYMNMDDITENFRRALQELRQWVLYYRLGGRF